MWPFGIELVDEVVEAALLLKAVHTSGAGRFFLQGKMHAFVAAILLRVTRLDALDRDAQAQPPDRELREVEQPIGVCEGDAIVGADG